MKNVYIIYDKYTDNNLSYYIVMNKEPIIDY